MLKSLYMRHKKIDPRLKIRVDLRLVERARVLGKGVAAVKMKDGPIACASDMGLLTYLI